MSACEELGARVRRVTYKSEPNGEPLYCPYCEIGELDSWNCYPQCEEIYDLEATKAYFATEFRLARRAPLTPPLKAAPAPPR